MDQPFVKHRSSLNAGQAAPDFALPDQEGVIHRLADYTGKTLILYFYPKDDTPGCTAQACSLRDHFKPLKKKGYALLGVSSDSQKSHLKFAKKYNLPFPLLSDTDLAMCRAYDVWAKKLFFGRIIDGIVRTTFVIGPDGRIRHIISDVDTKEHAEQLLELGN